MGIAQGQVKCGLHGVGAHGAGTQGALWRVRFGWVACLDDDFVLAIHRAYHVQVALHRAVVAHLDDREGGQALDDARAAEILGQ